MSMGSLDGRVPRSDHGGHASIVTLEGTGTLGHVPTLVDRVVDEVRKMILTGVLKPGQRLIEDSLARDLGVSRPPLREALRILGQDGLVRHVRRHGVTVARLTSVDIQEVYSLRWGLERLAIELSTPVSDKARLVDMETALAQMRVAAGAADGAGIVLANWNFHLSLCALARHRRLLDAYHGLTVQLQMGMAMNLRLRESVEGSMFESIGRHEDLLERIRGGEKAAIMTAIDRHGDMAFARQLAEMGGWQ